MANKRVSFASEEEGRHWAIDSAIEMAVDSAMDNTSQPVITSFDCGETAGVELGYVSDTGAIPVDVLRDLVQSTMREQHLDFKQTLQSWELRQEELVCRLEKVLPLLTDRIAILDAGRDLHAQMPSADLSCGAPKTSIREPLPPANKCPVLCTGTDAGLAPIATPGGTPVGTPEGSDLLDKSPANFSKAMKLEPVPPANGDLSMPVPDGLEAGYSTAPRPSTTSSKRPSTTSKASKSSRFRLLGYQRSGTGVVLEHAMMDDESERFSGRTSGIVGSEESVFSPEYASEVAPFVRSKSRDAFKLQDSCKPLRPGSFRDSGGSDLMRGTFSEQEQKKHNKYSKAAAVHQRLSIAQNIDHEGIEIIEDARGLYPHIVQPVFSNIAYSRWFEYLSTLVIVTNALFIGVQVEYMAMERTDITPGAFLVVQVVYVFLFTVELVVRILAEGSKCMHGDNWKWNVLDAVTVGISILELGLEASSQASVVRLIRVVRIVRIVRIIRTVRFYRALRLLVYSIFGTLRQLGWTLVLLVTIMYMFGIIFTQAANDHLINAHDPEAAGCIDDESSPACTNELVNKYFGTLARTMFSLFKTICGGLDWEGVVDPLSDLHWFYVALFVTFVAFMMFAVLNVVIGVFCNSAIENAHKDQEAVIAEHIASKQMYIKNLRKLFQNMESLKFGVITLEDLENFIQQESLSAWFGALELDVSDAWTLFKLLDTSENNVIGVEEFVEGCLRLRGNARSIDLARMMYENRWMMNKLVRLAEDMERSFMQVMEGHVVLSQGLSTLGNSFGIALPRFQLEDEFVTPAPSKY